MAGILGTVAVRVTALALHDRNTSDSDFREMCQAPQQSTALELDLLQGTRQGA